MDVLRAQSRQCAHEEARLWASLVEVGLAVPPDELSDGSSDARAAEVAWASSEVAAALTWTSRSADRELDLAQVVVRALPQVFAALWAGEIDRGKAVVFAGHLDPAHGVTPEQAAVICARLLPIAPKLTTAQLRGRLWRAVLAIDPGWARRRYTRAVRGRAVAAVLADDGTVTITGSGLPADEAAVACARVDRLAEAARRAGHPCRAGQIAADVYLGLLDGRFHGLSEEQTIAALLRELRPECTGADESPDDQASDGRAVGTTLPTTVPGTTGPTSSRRQSLLPATQEHARQHRPASRSGSAWPRSSGSTSGLARSPGSDPCCPGSPEISWRARSGGRSGASPSPILTVTCSWPG